MSYLQKKKGINVACYVKCVFWVSIQSDDCSDGLLTLLDKQNSSTMKAICDKFPEIRVEDCEPLRVIRGIYFSFKQRFLTPWYTHVRFLHVRNVRFSERLACFVFLKNPLWDSSFALLPTKYSFIYCLYTVLLF